MGATLSLMDHTFWPEFLQENFNHQQINRGVFNDQNRVGLASVHHGTARLRLWGLCCTQRQIKPKQGAALLRADQTHATTLQTDQAIADRQTQTSPTVHALHTLTGQGKAVKDGLVDRGINAHSCVLNFDTNPVTQSQAAQKDTALRGKIHRVV